MKIARYRFNDMIAYGILDEDEGELITLAGDPMFAGFDTTGGRVAITDVTLLAPVIPRSKVVGVGRNYRAHAEEMGGTAPDEPLLFLIPNTAVIGPGDPIVLPAASDRVEHEAELAVVIGKIAKNVAREGALDHVFGYTAANDVTARDLQRSDPQWTRAKGFDSFCPLGPIIETEWDKLGGAISASVNGVERQSGKLSDMVHSVADLVSYASGVFTLLPGDVILTGTPAGVGPLVAGDHVEVRIAGLGTLSNPVVAARS